MPPHAETIDAASDPRIAAFAGVGDPALARQLDCFVAEGRQVVRRVIEHGGYTVRALMVSPAALGAMTGIFQRLPDNAALYVAGRHVFAGVTGYDIHQGCLALVERPRPRAWHSVAGEAPKASTLVVLEAVGNPDNIGGVFRNAAALGASAVLLDPACSDPLYRKAVRTSMGSVLEVPYAVAEPWPAALETLRDMGWSVAALAGSGEWTLQDWVAHRGPASRLAWVLGHEGHGLSRAALHAADARVRIPMSPGADSLNVATAAALALYATAAMR